MSTTIHNDSRKFVHLLAGGIGATTGQCVTCPLDVVLTRLQSSKLNFGNVAKINALFSTTSASLHIRPVLGFRYFQMLFAYMRHMVHTEGFRSLFKGLSPSLFGIVPAKSVYFFCYANAKDFLHHRASFHGRQHTINSTSAVFAGSITGTVTNPIWYIKTKLQLNRKHKSSVWTIIKTGYAKHGARCFFRGLTASYVGVLETVIYFLLYEDLKQMLNLNSYQSNGTRFDALNLMFAAVVSKVAATSIMYPHEVIRVRLREDKIDLDGRLRYRNFAQALYLVFRDEGRAGLYGGFGTSLLRQVPNTAVMFLTYEAILFLVENK